MMNFIKQYFIALIIFLIIDMAWLLVIAKKMYENEIGWLMAKKPNLIAAVIFYLIFVGGLVYFAIMPAIFTSNFRLLIINAALFGLMTYATYDLTSLAVVKNWPVIMSIIDIAWGMFISIATSMITWVIFKWIGG